MTSPNMDRSNDNPRPVEVKVNNFPNSPRARKTSFKTIVLDPAGGADAKSYQVCDYEPTRCRIVLHVLDAPCVLTVDEVPRGLQTTSIGVAPDQGRVLPNQAQPYEFFGPDAMYLSAVVAAAAGRVTITKEYL